MSLVCLLVLPDTQLCAELNSGIRRCLSDQYQYHFSTTLEEAVTDAHAVRTTGDTLDLVVVDSAETCDRLRAIDTEAFSSPAFAVLDSLKDDFYTHYDSYRKRVRADEGETDSANPTEWDRAGFLACVMANLNDQTLEIPSDEANSPLAGISKLILDGIDPATLQPTPAGARVVTHLNQLSSALSDIDQRRDRRREISVPFALAF